MKGKLIIWLICISAFLVMLYFVMEMILADFAQDFGKAYVGMHLK